MPYKVEWLVEKRVVLSTYEGLMTMEDARGQVREANVLLRQGIPLTHSIVDMSKVEKFPSLQLASEFMSTDMTDIREKLGWTIVVTNNKLLINLFCGFKRLTSHICHLTSHVCHLNSNIFTRRCLVF